MKNTITEINQNEIINVAGGGVFLDKVKEVGPTIAKYTALIGGAIIFGYLAGTTNQYVADYKLVTQANEHLWGEDTITVPLVPSVFTKVFGPNFMQQTLA
jgi:hypothetical protein